MSKDSETILLRNLIGAGEKAVADFMDMSGGWWFDMAPEYFLTTYLASSIRKLDETYALLEVHVGETRVEARACRAGRPAEIERRNGRYDFVIYWADGTPRGAVEVKSPICIIDENRLTPDFWRICTTISSSSDSSFQFGAFVYYASVSDPIMKHDNASGKLRNLVTNIHLKAMEMASQYGLLAVSLPGSIHRGKDEDGGAWCLAAIIFKATISEQDCQ